MYLLTWYRDMSYDYIGGALEAQIATSNPSLEMNRSCSTNTVREFPLNENLNCFIDSMLEISDLYRKVNLFEIKL